MLDELSRPVEVTTVGTEVSICSSAELTYHYTSNGTIVILLEVRNSFIGGSFE